MFLIVLTWPAAHEIHYDHSLDTIIPIAYLLFLLLLLRVGITFRPFTRLGFLWMRTQDQKYVFEPVRVSNKNEERKLRLTL